MKLVLALLVFSSLAIAQSGDDPVVDPTLVPQPIAAKILQDARLAGFVANVGKDYGVNCPLPAVEHLMAFPKSVGSGDFAETFYTFSLPCVASHTVESDVNLSDLQITAEYMHLPNRVLDLTIATHFRE